MVTEQRQGLLHGEEDGARVGAERQVEVLWRGIRQGGQLDIAGIGDEDVQDALFSGDSLVKIVEVA